MGSSIAIATGSAALATAAALWAAAERYSARKARIRHRRLAARSRLTIGLREALLGHEPGAIVAWDRQGRRVFCQRDGDILLRDCLDGPEGSELSAALELLHCDGIGFRQAARNPAGTPYVIEGYVAAGMATVRLEQESAAEQQMHRLMSLLDAVPLPIWLRDGDLTLRWANQAFLRAVGVDTRDRAYARQATLDRAEPDIAAAALAQGTTRETGRYSLVRGVWRSFALTHVPLEDGAVAGVAQDVSDTTETEFRLRRQVQNQCHVLDSFRGAIAIFGVDRKLESYNAAFAKLWALPREWLDAAPSHEVLLDRLREGRKLPERRDFQGWKRQRLALYGASGEAVEDRWILPDGRTLCVTFCNNPLGGATVLYEDVTETFALESSLKLQLAAHTATLDALSEAVAAFGPDGRLTLHNAAFADIWQIGAAQLAERPHIRDVADQCLARFGDLAMWDRLVETISSSPAQRRNWRKIQRSDGSVLSLTTMPLPDRGTLVVFVDISDSVSVETAARERNEALRTLDRLRSDYNRQISYELRTPLNTVLGFAEQLMGDPSVATNERVHGQVGAITDGARALKAVVEAMLAELMDGRPLGHPSDDATSPDAPTRIVDRRASGR